MASLQQIEFELAAINEAAFQQLGDDYFLHTEGFPSMHRTGSTTGKRKTKKGTPDTWWQLPSGQYVFVEYTTREGTKNKKEFFKKLSEDLAKCLDRKKTGVAPANIKTIILCFNNELSTSENEALKRKLNKYRIELRTVGLQALALDIYARFPFLANRHLSLQMDTGQLLPLTQFVQQHESENTLATTWSNTFFHRKNDLKDLQQQLSLSNIIGLSGPPGVGKSKLALELMLQWKKTHPGWELYCIANKNQNLAPDLSTYLKPNQNYLLFIDDANRQSQHLLAVLPFLKSSTQGSIKLIITIRDYAKEFIELACSDFDYKMYTIERFSDEELEEILKSDDFKIKNPDFIRRILQIANGNVRIAIMAARLAIAHQDLNVLHHLFDLYDLYFTSFIKDQGSLKNINIQKTLGLFSFFFSLSRTERHELNTLLARFDLDYYNFNDAVVQLENMELLETSHDQSIIRISDQVLSSYFFYKVFIKEAILDFSVLLNHYFEKYSNRFKDTLIPALNDFGYERVIDPIESSFISYFFEVEADDQKAYQFLDALWFALPEHALNFIREKIQALKLPAKPVYKADKTTRNRLGSKHLNLKIAENFFYQKSSQLSEAVELAFEFAEKIPEQYAELYDSLHSGFAFSYDDYNYKFYRQEQLINLVINNSEAKYNVYRQMFFDLLPFILKTVFSIHQMGPRRTTFESYRYPVPADETIKELRKKIWQHATLLFSKALPASEEAIFEYIKARPEEVKEVFLYDLDFLTALIKKHWKPSRFVHCYYVNQLAEKCERLKINHPGIKQLSKQFNSKELQLYSLLNFSWIDSRRDLRYKKLSHDEFIKCKEDEITAQLQIKSLADFKKFYKSFLLVTTDPWLPNINLEFSLNLVLENIFKTRPSLAFNCIAIIIKSGNPSGFTPYRLINLINANHHTQIETFFKLISARTYHMKPSWLFHFFTSLPAEKIKKQHYTILLNTLRGLKTPTTIRFDWLPKFLSVDKNVLIAVLKICNKRLGKGIHLHLDNHFFKDYSKYFVRSVSTITDTYMLLEKMESHFDYNGEGFLELLKLDNSFLMSYVTQNATSFSYTPASELHHVKVVWKLDNAELLIEKVFTLLSSKNYVLLRDELLTALFMNLDENEQQRALSFLNSYLRNNKNNPERVNLVFHVFRNQFRPHYSNAIKQFLLLNHNINDFKKLDLLNNSFFSTGKVIWADIKAKELTDILNTINKLPGGSKFLPHKVYLKNQIIAERKHADNERNRRYRIERWA